MALDLPNVPWVAADTETSGLHPDDGATVACVALAYEDDDGQMWSVGLPFDQGVRDKLPSEQMDLFETGGDPNLGRDAWEELLEWLTQRDLIWHNAKFDLFHMENGTRHWPGRDLTPHTVWDTMIGQRELDPTERAGLDATAKRLGLGGKQGLSELKDWLKRRGHGPSRYDLVPWSIVETYVTTDAEMTASLYKHQIERFDNGEADYDRMERELQLMETLLQMEKRGVGYDTEASMKAAFELERRAAAIEAKMPFECTPAGAKRHFVDHLGLPVLRRSEKTGKPSVDEEQIRAWRKDGVEWTAEYAEVTKVRRAISMWYQGYPEKASVEHRLRCTYKQTHVRSGRMSVERIQLQAMPKADKYSAVGSSDRLPIYEGIPDVRSLLRARDGYGLWSLDLSQAELRVASQYAQCQRMLEQLAAGADIHGNTCQEVLNTTPDDPQWKLKRDIAKRLTFGGIFQIGGEKFQATLAKLADIHLSIEECKILVDRWRRMYPEMGHAYRRAERKAAREGYVRVLPNTPYEIRSWFGPMDFPNTGWNRMVQGSLAEAFKLLLVGVEKQWPGYLILTVHDSIVLEMPEDEGDEIAREITEWGGSMMTELFKIDMKMDTDRYV